MFSQRLAKESNEINEARGVIYIEVSFIGRDEWYTNNTRNS